MQGGRDSLAGRDGNDALDGGKGNDQAIDKGDFDITITDEVLTGSGTDSLVSVERARLIGGSSANTLDATAFTGRVARWDSCPKPCSIKTASGWMRSVT